MKAIKDKIVESPKDIIEKTPEGCCSCNKAIETENYRSDSAKISVSNPIPSSVSSLDAEQRELGQKNLEKFY